MKNLNIFQLGNQSITAQKIEIVERKGLGHPDTICDMLAEKLSVNLSKIYLEKFGAIMHHNVDKVLLVGGEFSPDFGGGKMISPIEIYLSGRATSEVRGEKIDVEKIATETAKSLLEKNLPNLDVEKHVKIIPKIKSGSQDLVELFERFQISGEVPLSNDTSFGVGHAPFSDLENVVFRLEKYLNTTEFKSENPYLGQDIKIMGVRDGEKLKITVAAAFVGKFIKNAEDYFTKKSKLTEICRSKIEELTEKEFEISINTADDEKTDSVYITVTGTSAEMGDDGEVGRGNRTNGLITPYRPMSLEAAAGKNPISHVGKIYNVAATQISQRIFAEIDEIDEVYCYIVSQIGKPITQPQTLDIKLRSSVEISQVSKKIEKIVAEEIERWPRIWNLFLEELISVC